MAAPPEIVTLTCPVCGNTEEAIGNGSMATSYNRDGTVYTTLSWGASAQHDCPGITWTIP